MTCTLLVWGFDVKDPWRSQELDVFIQHGERVACCLGKSPHVDECLLSGKVW